MDGWRQITDGMWRREANLPVGRAVAEIRKRDHAALYDVRLAVTFASARMPQRMSRTAIALQSLAEAKKSCNQYLRELVGTRARLWAGDQLM